MLKPHRKAEITLGVLSAIEENRFTTQRSVAKELGIALGLTNTYLKKCITKGLVKVTQAPANRYCYYLTPRGFAEKGRLTANYLSNSFNFFREARNQIGEIYQTCEVNGWSRVVFCGSGDFVEIAVLYSSKYLVKIIGIVMSKSQSETYAELRIFSSIGEIDNFDAVIIGDLLAPQKTFDEISQTVAPNKILVPRLLNISRKQPQLME